MRQLKITKSITNRESDSVEKYLQEIGKEDLLTAEQEVELAKRIKKGDQRALEKLVKANLRFVVSVAKQYQNNNMSLNDLINEGNLGLVKAAQKFDETKGFKFISYAVWWIRQSIMQDLAENSRLVRLPLNKVGSLSKINKAFSDLEQEFERAPTPEELSQILDMSAEEIESTLAVSSRPVSMDAPFQEGEEGTLLDVLENVGATRADSHMMYSASLKAETDRTLGILTERERSVLCLFYGIGVPHEMTLEDIGEHLGLTRERARQIKDKALSKLRGASKKNGLKEYLAH
jgi:RNA polymerase primary sigma factor